jgi:aryl-alcohol dehydrogenase-like predicted oxidoreductase
MGAAASSACAAVAGDPTNLTFLDLSDSHVTTAAGVRIPRLIYGTAWKETRVGPGATADLVEQAVKVGFCGIDTASQPKHYHEPGVGEGLARLFAQGVSRDSLFIQTKFSRNQDPSSVPYDEGTLLQPSSIAERVKQSVALSLRNLGMQSRVQLECSAPCVGCTNGTYTCEGA